MQLLQEEAQVIDEKTSADESMPSSTRIIASAGELNRPKEASVNSVFQQGLTPAPLSGLILFHT